MTNPASSAGTPAIAGPTSRGIANDAVGGEPLPARLEDEVPAVAACDDAGAERDPGRGELSASASLAAPPNSASGADSGVTG